MEKYLLILVVFLTTNLNKTYSQPSPEPVTVYGDLYLIGKMALSVEDRIGNKDSVVIGFGEIINSQGSFYPTRNIDTNIAQEVNILNMNISNPDIRIVQNTNPHRNGALEYFLQRNFFINYLEDAEVKFDVRSPWSDLDESDWLYRAYQPYNLKIRGTNFPLIVKSINYLVDRVWFDFFYAVTDSNGVYHSDNWISGRIPNSSDEWSVVDTINNLEELNNFNLTAVVYNLRTNINHKSRNTTAAYCTPNRVLYIPNPSLEVGEVIIYSTIGKVLSSFPLSDSLQRIILPTQTSLVVIKTQTSVWKSIY